MLKVLEKEVVEEVKCEVTLRLVDGKPADELTKALVEFLPKEDEEKEEDEYYEPSKEYEETETEEKDEGYEPYPD